jgi:hypothetical protein
MFQQLTAVRGIRVFACELQCPLFRNNFNRHLYRTAQLKVEYIFVLLCLGGCDSLVVVATRYGMDSTGFEPRWSEIIRTHPDMPRGPPSLLDNKY